MINNLTPYILSYGYWAVFLGSVIDHTGTPAALILSVSFVTSGYLQLLPVLIISFLGAFLSDIIFYYIGLKGGRPAINRLFLHFNLNFDKLHKTEAFFEQHGVQIIIWGRFLAIVSRYIPLVCGILNINFKKFIIYSILGNALMISSFGLLFYFLWDKLNNIFSDRYHSIYISVIIIILQILISGFIAKRQSKKVKN
jgi:membrane protein DedA with SNARE-associated domain